LASGKESVSECILNTLTYTEDVIERFHKLANSSEVKQLDRENLRAQYGTMVDELYRDKEQLFERLYLESAPSRTTETLSEKLRKKADRLGTKLTSNYDGVSDKYSVSFADIALDPSLIVVDHPYKFNTTTGQTHEVQFTSRFKKELLKLFPSADDRIRIAKSLQNGFGSTSGDGLKRIKTPGDNWFELRFGGKTRGVMRGFGCFGKNKKLILVTLNSSHGKMNPVAELQCPE
jgi:hypothetical protein